MATLKYSIGIQAGGGPQLAVNQSKDVQAFDRVQVKVPADGGVGEVDVDLQPSVATRISMLFITSSLYSTPADELKYRLSDGAGGDSAWVSLKEPQLFLGPAITLFNVTNPKLLKLKNAFTAGDATKQAVVDVFVGRNATA